MLTMLVLTGLQSAAAGPAAAAVAPKVAIIVGPSGSLTTTNLAWGRAAAAEARHYTSNVVEVYTPAGDMEPGQGRDDRRIARRVHRPRTRIPVPRTARRSRPRPRTASA